MKRLRSSPRDYSFADAEINLTPLIDVVFVVLIIFIIIAPMLETDRVELADATPAGPQSLSPEQSPVAIYVKHDNTIWYGGQCVNVNQLTERLKAVRKAATSDIPQLFQDKRANFGTYQSVKNAVEAAGYTQMDIILKPS